MPIQNVVFQTPIPFSAEKVFAWHMHLGAFQRKIPPWMKVTILFCEGPPDQEGSKLGLKVRWGDITWKWILEHTGFVPGREFTHRQLKGPFSSYEHCHRVDPMNGTACLMTDRVAFRTWVPFLGKMIKREFHHLFAWRHRLLLDDLTLIERLGGAPLRILVTGSSGLIGRSLLPFLQIAGHQVVRLVRNRNEVDRSAIYWDPASGDAPSSSLEGFDAVIHLAGENIGKGRWTEKRKERLFVSRCRNSWLLSQVLYRLYQPPKVVISASAVGFYGNRDDEPLTEWSEKGEGFLPDLCQKWESAMQAIESRGIRVVHCRFGPVLSSAGGMLKKILFPFKMGAGGRIGSGRQYISWVSIDDAMGAIYHCLLTPSVSGAVNVVAPNPVRQSEFAQAVAGKLHRPTLLPLPAGVVRLLFGKMGEELLLAGACVTPQKLLETGYRFRHSQLKGALNHVMQP